MEIEHVEKNMRGHTDDVTAICFCAPSTIVTGGCDAKVRLFLHCLTLAYYIIYKVLITFMFKLSCKYEHQFLVSSEKRVTCSDVSYVSLVYVTVSWLTLDVGTSMENGRSNHADIETS